MGPGDVTANGYNNSLVHTRNIDRLAAEGMRFTHMHSAAAICAPSRYSLLTGNLPLRGVLPDGTWALHRPLGLQTGQRTYGHLFGDSGYKTALIGKTHLGGGLFNRRGGAATAERPASWTLAEIQQVDFLRGIRQRAELGFDYVFESANGIQGPPYIYFEQGLPVADLAYDNDTQKWSWAAATVPPRRRSDYATLDDFLPLDADGDGVCGELRMSGRNEDWAYGYEGFDSTRQGEVFVQAALDFIDSSGATPFLLSFHSQAVHIPHTPSTFFGAPVRGLHADRHQDMLHEVDLQVKVLMGRLDANGLSNFTMVIFTSDNGGLARSDRAHSSTGNLRGFKGSHFEGGHRVPFFVRWPQVTPAGVACDQPLVHVDLFATFAEMLNRSAYEDEGQGMDSESFYRDLTSGTCGSGNRHGGTPRGAALVQITTIGEKGMVAISPDGMKVAAVRPDANDNDMPGAATIKDRFTFVDLATDPSEVRLASSHPPHPHPVH